MSTHEPHNGDDAAALAGEFALGVLDGAERLEAERRCATDPAFAQAVETWQARLAGLTDEIAPEPAPSQIWSRIVRRLDDAGNIVELRLRRSVAAWRGVAAASMAVAAALTVAVVWPRPEPAQPPLLTATLSGARGAAVFVATYDPSRRQIVLAPASVAATPGRSPELWLIPTGGKPIALGVAAFERAVQLSPHIGPAGSGTVLAVSIEPKGGSPTGQPTGPVVATGKLETL